MMGGLVHTVILILTSVSQALVNMAHAETSFMDTSVTVFWATLVLTATA
jgi:hypothetical protein